MQQLVLLGTFFVLPVYLQVVLGLDAFETGKRLFPMSVTMFIAALLGRGWPRASRPSASCQFGLVALALAAFVLLGTIDVELNGTAFALALVALRRRRGPADVAARQRDHVVGAAREANEAGGLQGTAQNLGASLGTALIGSMLIPRSRRLRRAGCRTRRCRRRAHEHLEQAERGSRSCPSTRSSRPRSTAGSRPTRRTPLADDYGDAQLDGLKRAARGRDPRRGRALLHAPPAVEAARARGAGLAWRASASTSSSSSVASRSRGRRRRHS